LRNLGSALSFGIAGCSGGGDDLPPDPPVQWFKSCKLQTDQTGFPFWDCHVNANLCFYSPLPGELDVICKPVQPKTRAPTFPESISEEIHRQASRNLGPQKRLVRRG
jgi:hypothetical protein